MKRERVDVTLEIKALRLRIKRRKASIERGKLAIATLERSIKDKMAEREKLPLAYRRKRT